MLVLSGSGDDGGDNVNGTRLTYLCLRLIAWFGVFLAFSYFAIGLYTSRFFFVYPFIFKFWAR